MSNMADAEAHRDWLIERHELDPIDDYDPITPDPDPHMWPPYLWPEGAQ